MQKLIKKERLYFAHPLSLYGTLEERVIINALKRDGYEVVNPSDPEYQTAFLDYRRRNPEDEVMSYWLRLTESCSICAFTTFPDHLSSLHAPTGTRPRVSTGVYKEVTHMKDRGCPVFWIPPGNLKVEDIRCVRWRSWKQFLPLTVAQTESLLDLARRQNQ